MSCSKGNSRNTTEIDVINEPTSKQASKQASNYGVLVVLVVLGCDISVGVSNVGVIMCSVAMSNDRILFVQWLLVCVCV